MSVTYSVDTPKVPCCRMHPRARQDLAAARFQRALT
jgi:hypothetical protein